MARFYEVLRTRLFSWLKASIVNNLAWGFVSAFNSTRFSIGLAVGAYLFMRGEITIGTVYLIYQYLELLWVPINSISREFEDLQMAGASIRRVKELLDTKPTVQDGRGADLPDGPLGVEFSGVSFAYRPGVTVLNDVSFRLEPGRSLGLLGRTGSGKTTMSRLLFRFYDPDRGEVRLGGTDLRRMPLKALRGRVGLVTQEVQLFQASVRDNLTFFDRTVPDRRIETDASRAGPGARGMRRCLTRARHGAGGPAEASSPRARRSSWPSPASSSRTPTAWCSTRRRRGSIPRPRG